MHRQRISDDEDDENDDDENMEDIVNFENELSREDETNDSSNKTPAQKPKRGRKMTMTTKDNDAMCTTIEESTTILSDTTQLALNAKKKKRGRKSGTNQMRQESNSKDDTKNIATASTSDEDEECSASNCIRPTGKLKIYQLDGIEFETKIFHLGREVDWIQCDGGCSGWFHMLCVGININQVKADDDYICKKCKRTPTNQTTDEKATGTATTTTPTPTIDSSKKVKTSQVSSVNNGTATASSNIAIVKKRLTRSKDENSREKVNALSDSNEHSIDNSKENDLRPNNSTKNDSQTINTSRPKLNEK